MRLNILIQVTDDGYKTLSRRNFDYNELRSQNGAIAAEVYDLARPVGETVKIMIEQMAKQIQADVVFARMEAEAAEDYAETQDLAANAPTLAA